MSHPEVPNPAEHVFSLAYFLPEGKKAVKQTVVRSGDEPQHFVSRIRGLASNGGPGALPGLSDRDDGWDGFILISRWFVIHDCYNHDFCYLLDTRK